MASENLHIKDLGMIYTLPDGSSVEALKNLNFVLHSGEILTVLGPSGCGKTTLLNIIGGFLAPTSGKIFFSPSSSQLESGSEEEKANRLISGPGPDRGMVVPTERLVGGPGPDRGMVFQHGALFEWMTVSENIGFGPKMRNVPKNKIQDTVEHYLEIVGLKGFGQKAVYELSGGMQQRVALARCLANEPQVVLMDEPLGALDALTREKMQSLILKIWHETHKTIILITHSVEEALLLGNKIFIMAPRPGRIEKQYQLPFAKQGISENLRDIKLEQIFVDKREEILSMIWNMEEDIMGKADLA